MSQENFNQPQPFLDALKAVIKMKETLKIAQEILKIFQALFNPEAANNNNLSDTPISDASTLIRKHSASSLFALAPRFTGTEPSTNPAYKTAEQQTINELMVRTGMQERPQYFKDIKDPAYEGEIVFSRFLREFVQDGALDKWLEEIAKNIEEKEPDPSKKAASLEFLQIIAKILRWVGSDAINDPAQDPLNRYVEVKDINRAIELREWLIQNQGHTDYDTLQAEFLDLDFHIREMRQRAMKEGFAYLSELSQRMGLDPMSDKSPDEFMLIQEERWKKEKRQAFETYVLLQFPNTDIFEPNQIRAFWETVHRQQYGTVLYEIVCESFEEKNASNPLHQRVQQIWAVSQLDTIHSQPQEARSRMPDKSYDGEAAPNFGYAIEKSAAYQQWLANPMARACADVIVDAYHFLIDFGSELNIDEFLDRMKKQLSESPEERKKRIAHPHEYDEWILEFSWYLLKKIFKQSFSPGKDKTVFTELKKAAGNEANLYQVAKEVLEEFKAFSINALKYRPTGDISEKVEAGGYVFGIGFNGKLFDAPETTSHSKLKNEIWLTFSDVGRNTGGYLLLHFLSSVVLLHTKYLKKEKRPFINAKQFQRYKALIQAHVKQEINATFEIPDTHWNSHMLNYELKKRAQFEGFMAQLEQGIAFEQLHSEFKEWLTDTSNWYSVPFTMVAIKIPEEMPVTEQGAQDLARQLLLDALVKRYFSVERASLMPLLFLHWKTEMVKSLQTHYPITARIVAMANSLEAVPEDHQILVKKSLDQMVWRVHPELASIWQPEIKRVFDEFKPSIIKKIDAEIKRNQEEVAKIQSNLKKKTEIFEKQREKKANTTKIEKEIIITRTNLENLQKQGLQLVEQKTKAINLPPEVTELAYEDYVQFRQYFFETRNVAQCVEPVFSRVLGHDRFFSVLLSQKTGKTAVTMTSDNQTIPLQLGNAIPQDVIAPCDKRCQHHVLGHLYTGDALNPKISADRLDEMRKTHGLGDVPDRFFTFPRNHETQADSQPMNACIIL